MLKATHLAKCRTESSEQGTKEYRPEGQCGFPIIAQVDHESRDILSCGDDRFSIDYMNAFKFQGLFVRGSLLVLVDLLNGGCFSIIRLLRIQRVQSLLVEDIDVRARQTLAKSREIVHLLRLEFGTCSILLRWACRAYAYPTRVLNITIQRNIHVKDVARGQCFLYHIATYPGFRTPYWIHLQTMTVDPLGRWGFHYSDDVLEVGARKYGATLSAI